MTLPIKKLLHSFLQADKSWKTQLLQNWPEIIGNLKTKVRLEKIQESTLVLSVADACWLQELYLLSPILLKTINEKLDRPRIKRLRFKQAEKKRKTKKRKTKKTEPKKRLKRVADKKLSATEEGALHKIEDEQLEVALKKFLFRCRQEEE